MKLQNVLMHMRGASVKVNGTRYDLDENGFVEVGSEVDANKLLLNKSAWQLLLSMRDSSPARKAEVVIRENPESEAIESEPDGDLDAEYPDPTEEMTLPELKKLADAYHVSYSDQPKKAVLITRIMTAMYPGKE